MSINEKVKNELRELGLTAFFFGCWFSILIFIKHLLLEGYNIEFYGISKALIGALVVAKVILILELVPLGSWTKKQPAIVDVIFRTLLYIIGVFIILVLEKAFEARHEYDGFSNALKQLFLHRNMAHIWVNVIVIGGALLVFNLLSIIKQHLGEGGVFRVLMSPKK